MKKQGSVIAVLMATSGGACGRGEAPWTGTMFDSAGVTVVANPDVGMWAPGEERKALEL